MTDELSQDYAEYLTGTYDSPDRIVLNAYFRQGHIAGGFRVWRRQLYGNDDKEAPYLGDTRMAGIALNKPRMRAVLEAIVSLSFTPNGFSVSELATKVRDILGLAQHAYQPRHPSYDLKKFRAKTGAQKIGKSRRYQVPAEGLQLMSALLILRKKVIKPVLAGAGKPKRGPKPKHQSPIDALYQSIQMAMHNLFHLLGIAL